MNEELKFKKLSEDSYSDLNIKNPNYFYKTEDNLYLGSKQLNNKVTGVKGNAQSEYQTGNINITKESIGLDKVENIPIQDQIVNFEASENLENINNKDTFSTIFGKLKTWFNRLKKVAFSGDYNDLTNKPIDANGYSNKIGKDGYIAYTGDGELFPSMDMENSKGFLIIHLPQGFNNTMIKFTVSIFNNQKETSVDYQIAGYLFEDNVWHNFSAVSLGKIDNKIANLPVSFGHDINGNAAVSIGELTTDWIFPRVSVHDIITGYQNIDYTSWVNQWIINIDDENIIIDPDGIIKNTCISYKTKDADTVDGFHASEERREENTLVVRDNDGTVNVNYIDSDTPQNENPTISQVITTNSSDGHYRKSSLNHLKSSLKLDKVENKTSENIRGELTKQNVIDALTYEPLETESNGILTIKQNDVTKGSFSADNKQDVTVNIEVPTKLSELEKDIQVGGAKDVEATATIDDQIGTPAVTVTGTDVGENKHIFNFAFSNLKGEKGEQGKQGIQGEQGEQGIQGEKGEQGAAAGFGTPTATVDSNTGTPSVTVTSSGPSTEKVFNFAFSNLKGPKGDKGDIGGIPSVSASAGSYINSVGTPSVSVSSNGTNNYNFTFNYLKGAKGDKGDTGNDGSTPTIQASAGPYINSVGTPTVTVSRVGNSYNFSFDYLKGAAGTNGTNATTTAVATTSSNGLMSSTDKSYIENLKNGTIGVSYASEATYSGKSGLMGPSSGGYYNIGSSTVPVYFSGGKPTACSLTASSVGAASSSHTHTAADVGAATSSHTHSNYASTGHYHSALFIGSESAVTSILQGTYNCFRPTSTFSGNIYLGYSSIRWATIYTTAAVNVNSDVRLKENIENISEKYENFFKELRPVTFNMKNDTNKKIHFGLIAQEVGEAATNNSIPLNKLDMVSTDDDPMADPDMITYWGLAYSELHGLEIHMIQKLMNEIELLKSEIELLKGSV